MAPAAIASDAKGLGLVPGPGPGALTEEAPDKPAAMPLPFVAAGFLQIALRVR